MEGVKAGGVLWAEGFREACCLHRVLILCLRSRTLLVRTGQCFLLNGFIFLGSIFVLNSVVIPALWWILPDQCSQLASHKLCDLGGTLKFYSFLRLALIQLFYVLWFYPLYVFSIVLSTIWYNDIAKYGYAAMGRSKITVEKGSSQNNSPTIQSTYHAKRPSGLGGVMIGIGEQVYSILLLSVFFLEVYATGFIPYIGKALNFLLLSWMYAYYCFEYKWNFNEVALDKRLDYFESYWPFFAGFGSPCVLAIFFFSPLVSYGIMAILFPLFVLTATGSEAEQEISFEKYKWRAAGVERLPIFYVADNVSHVIQKGTWVVLVPNGLMIDDVANCYGCGCYLFYPWRNGTSCKTEKGNKIVIINDSAISDYCLDFEPHTTQLQNSDAENLKLQTAARPKVYHIRGKVYFLQSFDRYL